MNTRRIQVCRYGGGVSGAGRKSLIYLSSDGFTAPLVTDAEKQKRRKQVLAKRRRCGKKHRTLARVKRGSD